MKEAIHLKMEQLVGWGGRVGVGGSSCVLFLQTVGLHNGPFLANVTHLDTLHTVRDPTVAMVTVD